jgi:hypothetical protein
MIDSKLFGRSGLSVRVASTKVARFYESTTSDCSRSPS